VCQGLENHKGGQDKTAIKILQELLKDDVCISSTNFIDFVIINIFEGGIIPTKVQIVSLLEK
jgi:hypothetical protein